MDQAISRPYRPAPAPPHLAEEVARLVRGHPSSARIAVVGLLRESTPESVHSLLSEAQRGAKRQALRRLVYLGGCGGSLLALTGTVAGIALNSEAVAVQMQPAFACLLGIAALGAPAEHEVAAALMRLDDPKAAGPIAGTLDSPETRWVAEEVLIRLLPRMRPADAGSLSQAQRASLYRNLRRGNTRFVLACLRALQQIGDESSLPHVKRLAELRGNRASIRLMRDAARETLPFLEGLIARERNRRTLLRVAHEPTDRLPRPAAEPTDRLPRPSAEPPDKLLKPLRWSRIPPDTMVRPHPDEDDEVMR
jgi:hypothetical protein